jgi:hypothetical protein
MNYISLGNECSSAAVLKYLNLRKFALPFDWIQTTAGQLYECLKDDFLNFHTNLTISSNKMHVIDFYGIEYHHDYPRVNNDISNNILGEDNIICNDWENYTETVRVKYERRINRFRKVLIQETPLIVLIRNYIVCARQIKELLEIKYNRKNIIFVVATKETYCPYHDIIICNPEKNGTWNDSTIWLEAIRNATSLSIKKNISYIPSKRKWRMFN